MKIYTRQGDKGKTRLVGGSSVPKDHARIDAYGTVDELNSLLGLIVEKCQHHSKLGELFASLTRIQNELFVVGGALACEDADTLQKLPALQQNHIETLEKEIDQMDSKLTPLKQFIIPGGHEISSFLHLARTVCRRAERSSVSLLSENPEVEIYVRYLNRMSDYLFTCARFSNLQMGIADVLWNRP